MIREPHTGKELQIVAAGCEALLQLDSARLYGLVTGGPIVNVDRCEQLIARAKREGCSPSEAQVDAVLQLIVREYGKRKKP